MSSDVIVTVERRDFNPTTKAIEFYVIAQAAHPSTKLLVQGNGTYRATITTVSLLAGVAPKVGEQVFTLDTATTAVVDADGVHLLGVAQATEEKSSKSLTAPLIDLNGQQLTAANIEDTLNQICLGLRGYGVEQPTILRVPHAMLSLFLKAAGRKVHINMVGDDDVVWDEQAGRFAEGERAGYFLSEFGMMEVVPVSSLAPNTFVMGRILNPDAQATFLTVTTVSGFYI